jgi:trk system potassium uptake protein
MLKRYLRKALRIFTRYQQKNKGPTLYELKSRVLSFLDSSHSVLQTVIPVLAFFLFGILIYDAGFNPFFKHDPMLYRVWSTTLFLLKALLIIWTLLELKEQRRFRSRVFNLLLIILTHYTQQAVYTIMHQTPTASYDGFIITKAFLFAGTLLIFLTEASTVLRFIYRQGFNPAFLFVGSFLMFIIVGALLLLLPNATTNGIRPVDAWFTAASAVCVTGLLVVDTATTFTHIGKFIIMCLIQLGGLGIMTFAGLLGYLSAGSVSFRNQLALKDMLSSKQIGTVISIIARVVVVTVFFETIGALVIFQTLDSKDFPGLLDKAFFAVFHSVSAFCNAGFSTYSNGLYESPVRFNYPLQLIVAVLVVFGGLGFPILFNVFTWLKIRILQPVYKLLKLPSRGNYIHVFTTTSKLALMTTLVLLVFGFTTYFLFELNASLREHGSAYGKIVTALFGAITPRTAGFNTVDLSMLTLPMIMVYLLLMWIGASPGSTGGGIKTTVIAVAFLNMRSVILGKERTEILHTQIGESTIHRAFAIILLSLLIIGTTVLLLAINEPDQPLFALAFEGFSAFSTVGLSLGVTPELSMTSKILLSFVMLTGRVGTLTIFFALISPAKELFYRYPKDEISL